jgi:hypothetical protein
MGEAYERGDGRPDEAAAENGGRGRRTRRAFLAGAGATGGAVALDLVLAQARQITGVPGATSIVGELPGLLLNGKPSFTVILRRREDFLLLRIDGYNLVRHGQRLVRELKGRDAFLVVTHQPQHVLEQAFVEPGPTPKSPGKSKALLAYPSRLAFSVPSGKSIPLTVAGLLDWAGLDPSLVAVAAYNPLFIDPDINVGPGGITPPGKLHLPKPPKWPPKAPTATQTAIELPWHLVISPGTDGNWSHPRDVLQAHGWAELWHTRLAATDAEAAADGGTFRAVWNYDTRGNGKPTLNKSSPPASSSSPFLTSLDSHDRYDIVRSTSDFQISGRQDVEASKLWLSARGGFLDSNVIWENLPPSYNLTQWKHLATIGRDQYVKVVLKGFLFPFGHRAVEIVVTERQFEKVGEEIVATSRQISYLVVRQPTKSYDPADTFGIANDSRDLPFRSLTITTLRTPDITKPTFVSGGFSMNPFVPTVGGKPFLWHFIGTDWIGQQVDFTAAAVFVTVPDAFTASLMSKVRNQYNNVLSVSDPVRLGQFTGQEVAFGPSNTPGDTNLQVQTITFGAGAGSGGSLTQFEDADQPISYPNLVQAEVTLSAAEQASGGTPLGKTPVVNYHPTYVNDGGVNTGGFNTSANKGNVFMEIAAASQPGLNFSGGSSGGVMIPNIQLSGLSRSLGPVAGDVSNILDGTFDPSSVFSQLNATILGGVKLIDLIKAVTGLSGDSPSAQAMQILYSTVGSPGMEADLRRADRKGLITPPVPTTRTTHFSWSPDIVENPIVTKDSDNSSPLDPAVPFSFNLDGTVTTDLVHPQNSTFKLTGTLMGFDVNLMESSGAAQFICIQFKELTFTAASGQKSKVTVDIGNVQFLGVLAFIEQLEEFMDFSGDGGPKITIEPDGISADLAVSLPPIEVGVFSLSNIGVDAGFNLPFDGSPARFRFSFATQDNPFTLSVAIFGGGGFFGIAIGTDGVELIQASFDFGAMASIDLGVASGSVQLVAGVYFAYGQIAPPATTLGCILTGFVKLDGSLSILGIITLSLEFDLSLTYEDLGGVSSVTGTATLTVGVSVLFFSFSVSVTATKTFGGGSDGAHSVHHGSARAHLVPHLGGDDTPPTFIDQVPTQAVWNSYCAAFATD